MNDRGDSYEDEIDRMRRRHEQRKRTGGPAAERRPSSTSTRYADIKTDSRRNPRTMRRKKRIPMIPLLAAVVILAGGFFAYHHFFKTESGYWTIAVFGLDSRDGNLGKGALSDVEMLCTIDRSTGEIRLASVFRDTYLKIDSDGAYDKTNEAYFLGGPEQAIHTLQDNMDLHIDNYASFNWKAVVDAINILGGVDLEITENEFSYINSFITETVESTGVGSVHLTSAGANHLDGVQAVAYARLRLMDTDFNRTERQRKVLGLAMEKAKSADVSTLISLVNTVYPQISTSIGLDEVLSLAKNARKYYISQTSGFPFSHQEMKVDGKSCVIPTTLESNVIQLHSFLYDETDYTPSDTVLDASRHIAEVTGLGEPGKDTESGKNVGAEGNTGSTSGVSQGSITPTTAETAAVTEAESIEQIEETERAAETEAIEETIEALTGEETEAVEQENVGQEEEPEDEKHAITQGQTGENADSGNGPSGPGTTPTTSAPMEEVAEPSPRNALEAPGENSGAGMSGAEGGPGVSGPGN